MLKTQIVRSSKELTVKEKIKYHDVGACTKLDGIISVDAPFIITPTDYIVVHSTLTEKTGEEKEYDSIIIIDEGGNTYTSSSNSLITSVVEIMDAMKEGAPDEPYELSLQAFPSKNYNGKNFFKAVLV